MGRDKIEVFSPQEEVIEGQLEATPIEVEEMVLRGQPTLESQTWMGQVKFSELVMAQMFTFASQE